MTDAAWVALSLVERLGGKTLRTLLTHFGNDAQAVLRADGEMLRRVPGIGPTMAERIQAINLAAVTEVIPRWEAAGARIFTPETGFPEKLRKVDDAPAVLFSRGKLRPDLIGRSVAVVGTRTPSTEAAHIARALGTELAKRGCTVVSGLALGIDSAAHRGALDVSQGITVAILGCGVLNIYPPENRELAESILVNGTVMSEFHPYASPSASNLVARNRVISGLCEALIVVETGADGGAMHAARFAIGQGRPVYTFDSAASGNRLLLENGAKPLLPDLSDLPFQ